MLDTPYESIGSDGALSFSYTDSYLAGVKVARDYFSTFGIDIVYKEFFYTQKPLAILSEIPKVKAWHPDLIIGPHLSDQFLLLKNYFVNGPLIISPYASDIKVNALPDNFYSVSPNDEAISKRLIKFISNRFKSFRIINVTDASCIDCVDMTKFFNKSYLHQNASAAVNNVYYYGAIDTKRELKKIASVYTADSVILLQPSSFYESKLISAKISNYLESKGFEAPIFVDTLDEWGRGDASVMLSGMNPNYLEYRLAPFIMPKMVKPFSQLYKELYPGKVANPISYYTFYILKKVLSTYLGCKTVQAHESVRSQVKSCFIKRVKNDSQAFKINTYLVYKYDKNGETLLRQEV